MNPEALAHTRLTFCPYGGDFPVPSPPIGVEASDTSHRPAHPDDVTAIVTVTDDGGSSGRLRSQFGVLPPGDVRNCIAAAAGVDSPFRELL